MARYIIKENHTLNPTPLYVAYPVFKPCSSCLPGPKENEEPLLGEQENEHSSLLDKKDKKQKKKQAVIADQEELSQDPFLLLGFGMIAYRDLLLTFVYLFTVLSLILLPAMLYYKGHDGILSPLSFSTWSLGNMGYSSAQCSNIPLEVGKLSAQCPYGQIGQIYTFGVNPDLDGQVANKALCQRASSNGNCTA